MPEAPGDADTRRAVPPVRVYPDDSLPPADTHVGDITLVNTIRVPPRDARAIRVPAGHVLRLRSVEGPQVGDLNLFAADDLSEQFYSGKTRALHGTHVTTGDRLWSSFPHLRPMATVIHDSLDWYGTDPFGLRVHDVIGTRCDPYTGRLLSGTDYHHCCHSNLTRALAEATGLPLLEAEPHVHDVLNVFMCTGFDAQGHYMMKASPVRHGDTFDLRAEIDLLAVLSTCPGGDCGAGHSSDDAACFPLEMQVLAPSQAVLDAHRQPDLSGYDRSHGT
ncbi:hypothetical protein PARPLA_02409 [Rhodobacteraceae bacterium THAF1]|uniref:urea carboxylase-associated family protein n=1 Tax=Palleronia sp. THAF1 TaxID=2587842 RepID=UPI000F3B099E|nr:DUF1989 domain-containing protein [Palleronia sp. THAF1]QFU09219.1 hypothetical protein FIU81_11095 [Palleronia sp. THAF1]VDC27345.1 hypothetical protein PARPLA_02409 [Rhodobacteraceae bacterium THAF1]